MSKGRKFVFWTSLSLNGVCLLCVLFYCYRGLVGAGFLHYGSAFPVKQIPFDDQVWWSLRPTLDPGDEDSRAKMSEALLHKWPKGTNLANIIKEIGVPDWAVEPKTMADENDPNWDPKRLKNVYLVVSYVLSNNHGHNDYLWIALDEKGNLVSIWEGDNPGELS